MRFKHKIEDVDIMADLSEDERQLVIEEYKKGYHFLLFYGQIAALVIVVVLAHFVGKFIGTWNWVQRSIVYAVVFYFSSLFFEIVEINFFSKRILKDLIKKQKEQSGLG